jgi:hypothetical protein
MTGKKRRRKGPLQSFSNYFDIVKTGCYNLLNWRGEHHGVTVSKDTSGMITVFIAGDCPWSVKKKRSGTSDRGGISETGSAITPLEIMLKCYILL